MTLGKVKGIIANLVTVAVDGPVAQNEICYISVGEKRLMAEVIKVIGANVYVQVFESTRGLKVGNQVEFTGHMLEVTLGPGLLSRNYDGLQNDLDKLTGVFLQRGEYNFPLDEQKKWDFKPLAKGSAKWTRTTSRTRSWFPSSSRAFIRSSQSSRQDNTPLTRWWQC